jgi:ribosomal protein S18 acetylase RimI-like enzyme
VRPAGPADAASIAGVHQASWRTTYGGILPAAVIEQMAGRKSPELWARRLEAPVAGGATLVAERGGEIVGFASCGPARHWLDGLEAEVYALYVLQEHQRQGVGRALLSHCARHFVRQGLFGFYLWALKANRARLFYEALGGAEAGEKSERLGEHSFTEVAYAWHDLGTLAHHEASESVR